MKRAVIMQQKIMQRCAANKTNERAAFQPHAHPRRKGKRSVYQMEHRIRSLG